MDLIRLAIFTVLVFGCSTGAWAQGLQKIVAAYSSLSATQAMLWLAKEAGRFQRHGLHVDLIYISTATKMQQALVGGKIKIGQGRRAAPVGGPQRGAQEQLAAVTS